MFFKKKPSLGSKLTQIVPRVSKTGYMFVDINNDLGHASEEIMKSSPEIIMTYGYARRAAVAALYLQGIVNRDVYDHVSGIFKALQQQTGASIEFQERSGANSIEFMQAYHQLISGLFVKKLIEIVRDYDLPKRRLSDADLFEVVIDTIYSEQEKNNGR